MGTNSDLVLSTATPVRRELLGGETTTTPGTFLEGTVTATRATPTDSSQGKGTLLRSEDTQKLDSVVHLVTKLKW